MSKNLRFEILTATFLLTLSLVTAAQAQGTNRLTMRDRVRAITQAEMDRQLLLNATLPAAKNADEARKAVLKQVREDFKELQALNNKMMAEAWATPALNYGFVVDMVSRIKGKASRLKMNLNLPQPEAATANPLANKTISNANDFRAALMVLDHNIMTFVSNPIFQTPNTIEIKQGTDARRALETVLDLTDELKRTASRLGKTQHSR